MSVDDSIFLRMHVNTFFFLTFGLHTVLLSSSTCDGLLFQDFITTIVTVTRAHWAPDLRRARTGDSTSGRESGSLCEPRTSRKTITLFTLFNRLQL